MTAVARARLALGVLTAVAFALRFHGLDRASLWLDEVLQLNCTALPLRAMWDCFPADKPPLDYLVQWLFLRGGGGETTARFHACLLGTLTIPALWLLGRRLGGTAAPGLAWVLALLGVASPLLIRFAQEGRPYALMLLVETLALAATWQVIRRTAQPPGEAVPPRDWLALAGALLLCLWTHYLALFGALAGMGLALAILAWRRPRPDWRRMALPAALIGAVALTAVPLWIRAQGRAPSEFSAPFQPDTWKMIGPYLDIYTCGYEWWMRAEGARWAFVVLAVAGWSGWAFGPRDGRRAAAHFCLAHFALCFFGPFLAYRAANHWMEMRYTLAAFPSALALAAMGLETVGRLALRRSWGPVVMAGGLALGQFGYVITHPFLRSDWRELGRRLAREARADAVVVVGENFNRYGVEYYLRRRGLEIPVVVAGSDPAVLRQLREEGRDVWSVVEGYAVPPAFAAERDRLAPLNPPIYGVDVRR